MQEKTAKGVGSLGIYYLVWLLYSEIDILQGRVNREKVKDDKSKLAVFWRRRGDSNSRAAFTTYTLSRGASSANLSTSPGRIRDDSLKAESNARHIILDFMRIVKGEFQKVKSGGQYRKYRPRPSIRPNRMLRNTTRYCQAELLQQLQQVRVRM